jgi:hypothetical protein
MTDLAQARWALGPPRPQDLRVQEVVTSMNEFKPGDQIRYRRGRRREVYTVTRVRPERNGRTMLVLTGGSIRGEAYCFTQDVERIGRGR